MNNLSCFWGLGTFLKHQVPSTRLIKTDEQWPRVREPLKGTKEILEVRSLVGWFAYERCVHRQIVHSLKHLTSPGRGSLFKVNKVPDIKAPQHMVNKHPLPHSSNFPKGSNQAMVEPQSWPDNWGVLGKGWIDEGPHIDQA